MLVEYVVGSTVIFLFYQILFTLKRVEYQINPKFENFKLIIQKLKR